MLMACIVKSTRVPIVNIESLVTDGAGSCDSVSVMLSHQMIVPLVLGCRLTEDTHADTVLCCHLV